MKSLDELLTIAELIENKHVLEWKNKGSKIIGYACTYMPEEILYAFDMLPYRLTGKGAYDTSLADSYLARVNCSFCRSCLELGITGKYDFLDGAVFITGCDHNRRVFDNWKAHPKALPFMHMLPVPHLISDDGFNWFKEEVILLIEALERHFELKFSPEKLKAAIALYNETRRLLRKLYELRAGEAPPLSGAEMLGILAAASAMPKGIFNKLLQSLLEEIRAKETPKSDKARLLIAGSLMDEPEFLKNIEDMGAVVVTYFLCFGTRSFWEFTDENKDLITALCRRYYNHASCPRMAGEYKSRLKFIKEQIKLAKVDGVILESLKFCDLHGTDNSLLKNDLEKEGIYVIELERQYGPLSDAGRIRTRVQAFLERIRG